MKIDIAKLIPLCLMLAGLGAALLLDEQQDAPSIGSTSARMRSDESERKPSRERMVARASERAPELEADDPSAEDELALEDELEALRSLTRAEAAEARRHEATLAKANRRVLYTQNLSSLEMAAGEAEVAGDAVRAEALRKRIELLSERAGEEEHDED